MAADKAPLTELGTTGLQRYGGIVDDEFLNSLRGTRRNKIYREMSENEPILGSLIMIFENLARRAQWPIEPADDSVEAQEVADFVDSCFHDMSSSWDETLAAITTMLVYGFAPMEITYKKRRGWDQRPYSKFSDGRIGWRKLALRAQDTIDEWVFDDEGGIKGMVQTAPPDYNTVTIPIEKLLLFRTSTPKNNPMGTSILRRAYRPWYIKKRVEEVEAIGIERDMVGLPIAWVPSRWLTEQATDADTTALDAVKDIVRNVRRNEQEGIVFPLEYDEVTKEKVYDFELLTAKGERMFDTDAVIRRYDQRMAMSMLADFILLGHESIGSFALGVSKVELFVTSLEAWMLSIAEVFNTHAFPRLLRFNGIDLELLPKMHVRHMGKPDLKVIANYINMLTAQGAIRPGDELEEHLRQIAGLPSLDEDEPREEEKPEPPQPPPLVIQPGQEPSATDEPDEDESYDDGGT